MYEKKSRIRKIMSFMWWSKARPCHSKKVSKSCSLIFIKSVVRWQTWWWYWVLQVDEFSCVGKVIIFIGIVQYAIITKKRTKNSLSSVLSTYTVYRGDSTLVIVGMSMNFSDLFWVFMASTALWFWFHIGFRHINHIIIAAFNIEYAMVHQRL